MCAKVQAKRLRHAMETQGQRVLRPFSDFWSIHHADRNVLLRSANRLSCSTFCGRRNAKRGKESKVPFAFCFCTSLGGAFGLLRRG